MKSKEKPVIRVTVWKGVGVMVNYNTPVTIKDFRTFKAAENFAEKWGKKSFGENGFYDPEITWNEAANKLLNI